MAFSGSHKNRKFASLDSLLNLFNRKTRRSERTSNTKQRRLTLDPLEERQMLSVSVVDGTDQIVNDLLGPNQTTAELSSYSYNSKSVAVDNDGDFVVTWTRQDPVIDPITNEQATDWRGFPLYDANIYARYFTDEVQRISLPEEIVSADPNNPGRFELTFGGDEVQMLKFYQSNNPSTGGLELIQGTFQIGFDLNNDGQVSAAQGEWTTVYFDESLPIEDSALNIENALQGLGGVLDDVTVEAISSTEYLIHFGDAAGGDDMSQLQISNMAFSSGFNAAAMITTVSEPQVITMWGGGIPVYPGNPEMTALRIEQAFMDASRGEVMGPIVVPQSFGESDTDFEKPEVKVVAISETEFEITFTGESGMTDQPNSSSLRQSTVSGPT